MKDVIVIGVDHGYAAMKTVHFSFPTGLVEYEHEPYTQKDVLEYNGRYYVVGSGRQPLQRDKIGELEQKVPYDDLVTTTYAKNAVTKFE